MAQVADITLEYGYPDTQGRPVQNWRCRMVVGGRNFSGIGATPWSSIGIACIDYAFWANKTIVIAKLHKTKRKHRRSHDDNADDGLFKKGKKQ
jgi:hypothetical protein